MLHTAAAEDAANSERSERSHQETTGSKEGDVNNATSNVSYSPSSPSLSNKRPRSDATSTTTGNPEKRRNSGEKEEEDDAPLDMLVDVEGEQQQQNGIERNGHNWEVEHHGSFERNQNEDSLTIDDIIPNESGSQWLLGLDDNVTLNDGTQYLQLQESDALDVLQTETDLNASAHNEAIVPHDLNLESSVANLVQDRKISVDSAGEVTTNTDATAIATAGNKCTDALGDVKAEAEIPAVSTAKSSSPVSLQIPSVQWGQLQPSPSDDIYANMRAPDIETRIMAPLTSDNSAPQSSAIRIAPRDQFKSSPTPISSCPVPARSNSSSASRPKRTRYTSNQVSPNAPAVAPAPASFYPVGSPNVTPGNVAYPVIPHPMAAPLLFAQGFPGAPNATASVSGTQGEQTRNNVPFVQHQRSNSNALKPGTSMDAGSFNGQMPMFSPQPGMMPVDPTTLMHMAQQMWMAAMAASGNSPHAQPRPNMNQASILGSPFLNVPGVPPMPSGSSSNKDRAPAITQMQRQQQQTQQHGGGRPIVITDDGKHVVVEQQTPAKLMRHPVLGRLQLQSKQQAAIEEANSQTGDAEKDDAPGRSISGSPSVLSKERRKRLVWTPELHERFVHAIRAVGWHQAVPKTLVQIMNVEGLTTEHVKSHLQKYRNSLKKAQCENEGDKAKLGDTGGVIIKLSGKQGAADNGAREVRVVPNRTPVALNIAAPVLAQSAPTAAAAPPSSTEVVQSDADAADSAEHLEPPSDDVRLQLQERTMQLQYQLQVMVHRTVALQKELQISIEEQREESGRIENRKQMATSKPVEEGKEEKESKYIEQMAALDRETQRVREELGMIQERLNKKGESSTGKG